MAPFILIWLGIWLLFAFWVSHIASGKGRSGGAWFLLGLIFGVFALLVVACLRDDRPYYDDEEYDDRPALRRSAQRPRRYTRR